MSLELVVEDKIENKTVNRKSSIVNRQFPCCNHSDRDAFVEADGKLWCKECYLKLRTKN